MNKQQNYIKFFEYYKTGLKIRRNEIFSITSLSNSKLSKLGLGFNNGLSGILYSLNLLYQHISDPNIKLECEKLIHSILISIEKELVTIDNKDFLNLGEKDEFDLGFNAGFIDLLIPFSNLDNTKFNITKMTNVVIKKCLAISKNKNILDNMNLTLYGGIACALFSCAFFNKNSNLNSTLKNQSSEIIKNLISYLLSTVRYDDNRPFWPCSALSPHIIENGLAWGQSGILFAIASALKLQKLNYKYKDIILSILKSIDSTWNKNNHRWDTLHDKNILIKNSFVLKHFDFFCSGLLGEIISRDALYSSKLISREDHNNYLIKIARQLSYLERKVVVEEKFSLMHYCCGISSYVDWLLHLTNNLLNEDENSINLKYVSTLNNFKEFFLHRINSRLDNTSNKNLIIMQGDLTFSRGLSGILYTYLRIFEINTISYLWK